jgi:hypothetical protein
MYSWMNIPSKETAYKYDPPAEKPKETSVRWITQQKCLLTQGAVAVNMVLIFFMGGVSIQAWCERHFGYAPNVLIPVAGAVVAAWLVGYVMLRSGMIREEQTFYARENDVLSEIKKGDK